MRPNQIYGILDMSMRARENGDIYNPLFIGPPGIGKTEIVIQWAKDRGIPFTVITLATVEPPDLRGYPLIETVNGRQKMTTAIPEFWPDSESTGKYLLILDELNRGNPSVMNCVMGLSDGRRGFDNYTLPKNALIVGCINPSDGPYDTNTMDPALADRFEPYQVTYDKPSSLEFMKASGWRKEVVDFVESGVWTYVTPESIPGVPGAKYVAPRTLSKLNAALNAGLPSASPEDQLLIYQSTLGNNIGKDFYSFLHNESPIYFSDLTRAPKKSLNKLAKFSDPKHFQNGMIGITVKDILDDGTIEDPLLVDVLKVIPFEAGTTLVRDLEYKRKDKKILERLVSNYPELKDQFKSVLHYGKEEK